MQRTFDQRHSYLDSLPCLHDKRPPERDGTGPCLVSLVGLCQEVDAISPRVWVCLDLCNPASLLSYGRGPSWSMDFKERIDPRKPEGDIRRILRNTTRMEGSHGQLRSRFADGLPGNDAHGSSHPDQCTGCQIGAVTTPAYAICRFAGEWGAHPHRRDATSQQRGRERLIQ